MGRLVTAAWFIVSRVAIDTFLFLSVMIVCLFVSGELGRKRPDLSKLYGGTEGVGTVDPMGTSVVLRGLLLSLVHFFSCGYTMLSYFFW